MNKFLIWSKKNNTLSASIISFLYFILCLFIGHLINVYIYKLHYLIYGMGVAVLFQYPFLKYLNKIDMKYKISKPYQDKKCNCKDCNCKD